MIKQYVNILSLVSVYIAECFRIHLYIEKRFSSGDQKSKDEEDYLALVKALHGWKQQGKAMSKRKNTRGSIASGQPSVMATIGGLL